VNLGVERDGMVEQIAQVDSTYLIGGTNWLGRPVPLHCAALGKVLLAYGAAELPPGALERRTQPTITSRPSWTPTWPRYASAATPSPMKNSNLGWSRWPRRLPRRRRGRGRAVGVRPGHQAHPGPAGRRRGAVRGAGRRGIRRPGPPAAGRGNTRSRNSGSTSRDTANPQKEGAA